MRVRWWLKFEIYTTKWIPCMMPKNFTILNQEAALEQPTFLIELLLFRVPETCRDAILVCRVMHWMLRVLQETFLNDHLLKKNCPLPSSTIQRIWHHPLGDWDLRVEWKENRWIRWFLHPTAKVEVEYWIILMELILTVVWLIIREFLWRNGILEFFMTLWNFKAGKEASELRFVYEQQILMSQCTGSKKLRWQSQITTSRLIVWRTDFTDFDMLDAMIAFALKILNTQIGKCRRAACSERRPILTWRCKPPNMTYEHFRATGAYEAVQGLSNFVQIQVCRMTTSKISTLDGINLNYLRAKCPQMWSLKDCTSLNYGTLFCFWPSWLWTIKKLLETMETELSTIEDSWKTS